MNLAPVGKIYFCTPSVFGSQAANYIQSMHMACAFAYQAEWVYIVMRANRSSADLGWSLPSNCSLSVINTTNKRFSSVIFSMGAIVMLIKKSLREKFALIYTRSGHLALFAAIFGFKNVALELHTGVHGRVMKLAYKLFARRGGVFICISQSIAKELVSIGVASSSIVVAPDGHGFEVEKPPITLAVGPRLKVGYFGSLTKQKGRDLLQEIILQADFADFYIFSKEIGALCSSPNLKEYRYLQYSEVKTKMLEMDVLLLTLTPQGADDRISAYTSPLKLYEYLAVSKPILVSDLPILREDIDDRSVFFCRNDASGFVDTLRTLIKNPELAIPKVKCGAELAKSRLWAFRVRSILSHFESFTLRL